LKAGSLVAAAFLTLLPLYKFSLQLRSTLDFALTTNLRLRASEERFRSLTVATSQVIWTTDPQGLVVEDSPSWRAFTGQSEEAWKGWGWLDALHPEDRERSATAWRQALADRSVYEAEYRVRRPDGSYTPVLARGAPVFNEDGTVREWVGACTDFSERVRAQEELRRAVRARDEFLGQAGHELRTPLTSLKLQIQSFQAAAKKAQAEDSALAGLLPKLDRVERQVKRLEVLTNALLDISRINTGRMKLELAEVNLGELTRTAVAHTLEQSPASAGRVIVDVEQVTGRWDAFRLEQVVTNLLSNALKYGGEQPVKLTVCAEGEEAVLTVSDRGIGIPPEDQARIFERFERAVSGRHYPGVGLGLWIVREVVHALGGTVTLDSRTGEGTTFTVRLPRSGPRAEAAE
jgi:PAS domain S-box-containing protein